MALQSASHERLIKQLEAIRDVSKRRAVLAREGFAGRAAEELLDEVHFRTKGKEKFPRAKDMRFTRDGLAQASSKAVAEYRTWKMRQRLGSITRVLDVGAGIGGDTIALALRWPVIAIENNAQTVELLRHNIGVYGVEENVEVVRADIREWLYTEEAKNYQKEINCIFFDPSRRPGGKRVVQGDDYEPPLSFVEELGKFCANMGVKISPLTAFSSIDFDCDIEVISHKGTVRDLVLWFGQCKIAADSTAVMATKLPERVTVVRQKAAREIDLSVPLKYLYEPDPAFTKAQLVNTLAAMYGLKLLDKRIGYLTSDVRVDNPVLKRYEICEVVPYDFGEMTRRLASLKMGRVDFKARGVSADLRTIHKHIRGGGNRRGLVVLTKIAGKKQALICSY